MKVVAAPSIGLNFGTHDAAAAIVIDGAVVAAAEEERFTRVKQTKAFPAQAIEYCLAEAGVGPDEIGQITLFVDPKLQLLLAATNLYHGFPHSLGSLVSDLGKYRQRRRATTLIRASELLAPSTAIIPVRHHTAHAASAYLVSPFEDATVVTIDGRGEYETACVFHGRGEHLARRHSITYPHSIGYLYSMMTRYLGFRPQRDEYKVMGLAGYGGPGLLQRVNRIATFDQARGRLRLNLAYFDHHRRPSKARNLYSDELIRLLGPPRSPGEMITDRHRAIAYAVQRLTEHLVLSYVAFAQRLVPSRALCLAGGVALNGVANAKIIESGLFDSVFVQPAANDAGTSMGAALYVASRRSAQRACTTLDHAFLGPAYAHQTVATALAAARHAGYAVQVVTDPADTAARLLARDLIIGWFHGRMEFGPRALGARSILANPSSATATDRVNALIKRREMFRPLAPAVLEEHATEYFHLHHAGRLVYPFMLATANVVAAKRNIIPAVIHIDATARVQTVTRAHNPALWRVIDRFRQRTGLPVVLNTSFNSADEPIVCTPDDAVQTFMRRGLDALVIENFLAIRPDLQE